MPPMSRGANVALTREIPGLRQLAVGVAWNAGAERVLEEAVVSNRELGQKHGLAQALLVLAGGYRERGEFEKADELLEESPLYREIVEKGMPDQVFLTRNPVEREVAGL